MISISGLTYHIGGRALYDGADLHVNDDDKIGLVGLNGTGKTTLLKLITGEITPDAGTISKGKNCTIGFLDQELLSQDSDESILSVALSGFADIIDIQIEIEHLLKKLETDHSEKTVNKLTQLQEKFGAMDGYSLQSRAEEILEGVGFSTSDLHRPLTEFSGGWRMRVILGKLLLEKPSLLLLDEPTNHLDLPSIQWVENYLRNYEGAVIVVSHDRTFLDRTISRTVEVAGAKLTAYEGNYSFYQTEKSLRDEIQQNAYLNQQQKIKQTERFIERFRAKATKARQVQSRIKSLERMDRVDEVIDSNPVINFKFDFSQRSGRHIINLEGITKKFGDLTVFEGATAHIERGDKIALIGANGKGKSTLLRIVDGSEELQEGKRKEGFNVIKAFYAQHQLEALTTSNEILDELKQAGSGKTEQQLRNVLGCFLFSDEDVFKRIKVLSGGEKSRVALAKTLISEANFLLLDEPTNHLDFQSENILIQALQQYQGSFIIVSHNRHFISQTANKIWYIENREIKEYPGKYEEFEYWYSRRNLPIESTAPDSSPKDKVKTANYTTGKTKRHNPDRNLQKRQREMEDLESRIQDLEKEVAVLEHKMEDPGVYSDADRLLEVTSQHQEVKDKLSSLLSKWESLGSGLEN